MHNGETFANALSTYGKCELVDCSSGYTEQRLTNTDQSIQNGLDYYYNKYRIDNRFRDEQLPNGCTNGFEDTLNVSIDGDDVNGDGSKLNPFASVNQALASQRQDAGRNYLCTLVIVEPGSYNQKISISGSDTNRNVTIYGVNRQNVNFQRTIDVLGWQQISNIDHDGDPETPNVNQCPNQDQCGIYRAPTHLESNQKSVLI